MPYMAPLGRKIKSPCNISQNAIVSKSVRNQQMPSAAPSNGYNRGGEKKGKKRKKKRNAVG
jgi:hypothetical protein